MNCSVQDVKQKLDANHDFLLLDVRTEEENEIAQMPGSANIPLHELKDRLPELDAWRAKEIVCTCHHGGRSAMAQEFLMHQGFTNVINLAGGIDAWANEIDQDMPTY